MTPEIVVTPLPRILPLSATTRALPRRRDLTGRVERWSLGMVGKMAPSLLLERLYRAYFTPLRFHVTKEQREILNRAERDTIEVGGQRLVRYIWQGFDFPWEPPAPAVLLVHGWSGAAAQMTPLVAPLRAGRTARHRHRRSRPRRGARQPHHAARDGRGHRRAE